MSSRRAIKGMINGMLGATTSRYNEFDGYFLFGYLMDELEVAPLTIDFLLPERRSLSPAARHFVQRTRADFEHRVRIHHFGDCIHAAQMTVERLPGRTTILVNNHTVPAAPLVLRIACKDDRARTYEGAVQIEVAKLNPAIMMRSGRALSWQQRLRRWLFGNAM